MSATVDETEEPGLESLDEFHVPSQPNNTGPRDTETLFELLHVQREFLKTKYNYLNFKCGSRKMHEQYINQG